MYAHHLPTRRFSLSEMRAMTPCLSLDWQERPGPDGFSIWPARSGRLVVVYIDPDDFSSHYAVRPIVTVPAIMARAA